MQLAGEAGSLLKIEEEIAKLVKDAKKLWETRPKVEQLSMGFGLEIKPQQGILSLDLSGISDERFWETAEERIYTALHSYAEQADAKGGYQRRLFAEDAARGFAFIDLCRKRYDVVLMNPPFGESSSHLVKLLSLKYPSWNGNILCAFIDCNQKVLTDKGLMGSVIDRTATIKTTYEHFRNDVLLKDDRIQTQINLGWGVLDDANVEVAGIVISSGDVRSNKVFFDISKFPLNEQEGILARLTSNIQHSIDDDGVFCVNPRVFQKLPNAVISFEFPKWLQNAFQVSPSISDSGCPVFVGHSFKSDRHFRLVWEIPLTEPIIFNESRWAWLFNGGDYSPFYNIERDVVLYGHDGSAVRGHDSITFRSIPLHGRRGIGYGKRGEFIDVQVLPPGHLFTVEGEASVVENEDIQWYMAALIGSNVFSYGINLYCGQHKYPGYVNVFPSPVVKPETVRLIVEKAKDIWKAKRLWQVGDETDSVFLRPRILECKARNFEDSCTVVLNKEKELDYVIDNAHVELNLLFEKVYSISEKELITVRRYAEKKPSDRVWINGPESLVEKRKAIVFELLSYVVGCLFGRWNIKEIAKPSDVHALPEINLSVAPPRFSPGTLLVNGECMLENKSAESPVFISPSGILISESNNNISHNYNIIKHVREALAYIWPKNIDKIEVVICRTIGINDLNEYFFRPDGFFFDHLNAYTKSHRQAPIYWPLSTAKGSYTLWVYYPHLTDQTLHAALADFVDPKLKSVRAEISNLRESSTNQTRLEELQELEKELIDFRAEIERIIKLPWKPNLNDGVLITASPLWKLFRLSKWQKDLKACWEKLEKGDYDWAHLAYTIWPKRVEDVCKKDRSVAIAHGLEDLCQSESAKPKMKRGKKSMAAGLEEFDS